MEHGDQVMRSTRWRLYLSVASVALALVVLAAGTWLTYTSFTARHPGGNDFYPRWVGGCALLREGANPYSEDITLRIQVGILGRPAMYPEEDRGAFAYPLYSLLFFWPLCATDNYPLARAIWLWVSVVGLIAAMVLWMRAIRWRPRLTLWVFTMFWAVFMYHNFRALLLGQFAIFVWLALVAALWAMDRGYDGWAGFFLVLSTVKPQLVYLAIPWILLWAAGKRRWRLWWGFGLTLAVLTLGSMILVPSWIPDFARQAFAYTSYAPFPALTWIVVRFVLGLGDGVAVAVAVVLAAGLLVLGWRLWRGTWEQMLWMLGLLLLMTNFFTPRIATTNYLTLMPWAVWGFCWMQRAWGRRGEWAVVAVEVVSLAGLWVLFLATIEGNLETIPVYFPVPVAMMLLLAWLWGRVRPREGDVSG